jgi:PEGA domain
MRVILLVLGLLSVAHADSQVGVVVVGEPTKQRAVKANLEAWLQQHRYATMRAPMTADAQKTLLDCFVIEDMACARGTFEKRSKAESIVFVRIELGGNREVALTGYWLAKSRDAVAEKRWCRRCDDAELRKTVDQLMTVLAGASAVGGGRLEIHTKPEGQAVELDGQAVGNAPIDRAVGPGAHVIKLVRDGRDLATKTVTIEAGASASVSLHADEPREVVAPATPPSPPPAEHESRSRVVPAVLIGAGVAGLATGGVYFYYGHKSGPNEPRIYPYATRDGVIATAAGAVSLVVGGILWVRAGSAPTVAITSSGASIGWAGRF